MPDDVYLRRVKDPNPMLLELARQACDQLERIEATYPRGVASMRMNVIADISAVHGVPIDYVLDERERRVRERPA